jgi:hypothetical protein
MRIGLTWYIPTARSVSPMPAARPAVAMPAQKLILIAGCFLS